MKTIEQRAKEYEESLGYYNCMKQFPQEAFIAGAKSEHEELTRWNSPECPPDNDRDVLLKIKHDIELCPEYFMYRVGFYDGKLYRIANERDTTIEVIGWREIHEN